MQPQPQPQYAMHHPNNGVYEYARRTPSPVGVLNNMARHHPHTRAPSISAGMPPITVDVARGTTRETVRRQQLPGDTAPPGYAAWDTPAVDRRVQYQIQQEDRRPSHGPHLDAPGHMEQQRRRASASPPAFPSAALPPPPPPPPPVLSAAQQGHLRQIQQHQRLVQQGRPAASQHVSQSSHGGGGQQAVAREAFVLPSPSAQRRQQPKMRGPLEQHWPSSGEERHGVLPLPRYAAAMSSGGTTPSPPLVQIYTTLSEAIHHQKQQQKKQREQEQQHRGYGQQAALQAGGTRHDNAHVVEVVREPVSSNLSRQVSDSTLNHQQGYHYHPAGRTAGAFLHSQHQQQQQQPRELLRSHSFTTADQAAVADAVAHSGRVSPISTTEMFAQNRPFQGPMPMPLRQAPPAQRRAQVVTPTAPVPPQMPLNVLVPGNGGAGRASSNPTTPVMVYATPHGYVMAYPPPGFVSTPHAGRSQAWNPYECVSPSEDNSQQGFARADSDNDRSQHKEAVVTTGGSPMKRKGSFKDRAQAETLQGQRSRASSNLSDVIERGFDDDMREQGPRDVKPDPLGVKASTFENQKKDAFETPRRVKAGSMPEADSRRDDKENACSRVGVVGERKKDDGGKQLAGTKRGGDEIAKQQSFTGSYFQVSPGSFLQRNKRQRNQGPLQGASN